MSRNRAAGGGILGQERSVAAVVAELRREFATAFQETYASRPATDPMLSVMFQALAVQIARIYDDANDVFPERVIDDLVSSLGLPFAAAAPAQVTVCFSDVMSRERLSTDSPILGFSRTGEGVRFALDVPIEVVPSTLRFAGVAEGGRLDTISGASVDDDDTPLPPATVGLGAGKTLAPILFLAIDTPSSHLSGLGIHIDSSPLRCEAGLALARSPWQVLGDEGVSYARGTLLPRASRGGVRLLEWTSADDSPAAESESSARRINLELAEGPYGHQSFVLPWFGVERRGTCLPPKLLRSALPQILPEDYKGLYGSPLHWFAIPLPAGLSDVTRSVRGVTLNAMTASNIEVLSEMVQFERTGRAVVVKAEGASGRHVLGVQSVAGDTDPYYAEADVSAPQTAGRYRADRFGVLIHPQRSETGRMDRTASVRLIFTDGDRGNGVEVGRVSRIEGEFSNELLGVSNVNPSRGGSNPPEYPLGRLRLAEALRSRERAVTRDDFDVLTKAYDSRVKRVTVALQGSVREGRVQPLHLVTVGVMRGDFGDPETEIPRLQSVLERRLQERVLLGQQVQVLVEAIA